MGFSILCGLLVAIPVACLTSATASDIVSLLVVLVGGGVYATDARVRSALKGDPILPATLGYVATLVLSMVIAPAYNRAFGVLTLLFPLVLLAATAAFRLEPRLRQRIGTAAGIFVVVSFVASFVQVMGIHPVFNPPSFYNVWRIAPGMNFYRATGLFKHPIHFAATMATIGFWYLGTLAYPTPSTKENRWFMALGAIAIVTAIATFTKSVWTGLVVGFIALALMAPPGRQRRAALVTLITGVVIILAVPATRARLAMFAPDKQVSRLMLWQTAGRMFLDKPVFGQGHQAFRARVDKYLPADIIEKKHAAMDPHNMYLEVLSGSGLVGFAAFLFWLGTIGWRLWTRRTEASEATLRWRAGAFASWAFLLAAGMFDHFLTQRQTTPMIFTLWAAGLAWVPAPQSVEKLRSHSADSRDAVAGGNAVA